MEKYIRFNTIKRREAANDFEKNFFKLLNNSVFGKTMENLRNRRKVDLVTNDSKLKKLAMQPSFLNLKIFTEDLVAIERRVSEVKLNRPIYTGFTILDVSKTLMYNWHYNFVKKRYPQESKLLFTDTDSLVYQIETDDIFSDMLEDQDLFDFSGYPKDHPCHSNANKKVIGKMKDELNGSSMVQFVGLRSKMYSVLGDFEMKKAKGVTKAVIQKQLSHQNYLDALFKHEKFYHQNKTIQSKDHKLSSVKQNKVSLCSYDDKRYILDNKISTLAYGHYSLKTL